MAYLSRADLDSFAERILSDFVKAEHPKGYLCYNVDPVKLAMFHGYNIQYVTNTRRKNVPSKCTVLRAQYPEELLGLLTFLLKNKYFSKKRVKNAFSPATH
jgi:hypothetical protein